MVKVVTVWLQAGFLKLILSLCFRTSGVFDCGWQYSWEGNIVVWAGVDLELRHLCVENRERLAISDDNILDHRGLFCWGASDSAMPQLARRWQHWVTGGGGFGSIYTSGQVTGSPQMWWFVLVHPSVFVFFLIVLKAAEQHSHFEQPELGTDVFTRSAVVL